jgi:hypothetical protein
MGQNFEFPGKNSRELTCSTGIMSAFNQGPTSAGFAVEAE